MRFLWLLFLLGTMGCQNEQGSVTQPDEIEETVPFQTATYNKPWRDTENQLEGFDRGMVLVGNITAAAQTLSPFAILADASGQQFSTVKRGGLSTTEGSIDWKLPSGETGSLAKIEWIVINGETEELVFNGESQRLDGPTLFLMKATAGKLIIESRPFDTLQIPQPQKMNDLNTELPAFLRQHPEVVEFFKGKKTIE